MKKTFLLILILIMSISLFSQDTDKVQETALQPDSLAVDSVVVLSEEDKLCKVAASEIMDIYDNWNSDRDYDIISNRIKGFIDNFYKTFPDYDTKLLEKSKSGEKLSDYQHRSLVAFKAMKGNVYTEVSRFVSNKNFYWGYIDDNLANELKTTAKKLGDYARGRKEELLSEQDTYVKELFKDMHKYQDQLDSLKTITDIKVIDDLLDDKEYNDEMLNLQIKRSTIKSQADIDNLDKVILEKLNNYFAEKKESLIKNKRLQLIDSRSDWVDEKRETLFDLMTYESRRINKVVSSFLTPMEEDRNIKRYDIDDTFLLSAKNPINFEEKLKIQIKNKFYSGLVGKFGFYLQFDFKPSFRPFRLNVLIGTILFMILFFYIFIKVKRNRDSLFIRKISGLDEIDNAVGRATEMGKPIVYDSGIGGYTNIDTIASMLILRSISKKVAEFKAEIYVPTCDPIIMQISEEMVASGFLDAGYPEDHKKDNIFFLAADQFAFAAGVSGILARKKPATAFHFGYYAAESLLISEAGFTAGAIQVAGTTAVSQLPFFITACDYTLIGEELYAAAAYISRDAQILTNLKLSDFAKVVIAILFILGTIMLTINSEWTFIQDIMVTR